MVTPFTFVRRGSNATMRAMLNSLPVQIGLRSTEICRA
jgi:hypothetical protein